MAKITFITKSNEEITLEDTEGSVMELAADYGVQGILGDCGGVCSCATCHVHVSPEFFDRLPPVGDLERELLDFDENSNEYSRLSCQIEINEDLDGMVLHVANE